MKHLAIIGAGITGLTTAYELIERGFTVTVFDKNRYASMETSYANGGQLSACNAEVWTKWSTVLTGLRWMLKRDAPLLVNPRPSLHKMSWMAEFLGNIPNYRANTVETVRLAIQAREALFDIAEREGITFDLQKRGILHIYENEGDLAKARAVSGLLAEGGLRRSELSVREIREVEPALKGALAGGFFTDSDSSGDIHKFSVGLAKAIEQRGGELAFGTTIADIKQDNGTVTVTPEDGAARRFDAMVVCAGIASRAIAAKLGDRVNIYPVKGYSVTLALQDAASRAAAPWVSMVDDKAKIVLSRLGTDRLRIAGTAEFNGTNRDIRADRIRPLIDWSEARFPGVSTEHVTPWAGLRPMTPSMLPRVGRGRKQGVFYNTGHGHLGWTLAGATARIVAETVAEQLGQRAYPKKSIERAA